MIGTLNDRDRADAVEPQWFDAYHALLGKRLDLADIKIYEAEISRRIDHLVEGDTLAAVRGIAERIRKGEFQSKFLPNANDLITQIIRNKYQASHPVADGEVVPKSRYAADQDSALGCAKSALNKAQSIREIYNIMSAQTDLLDDVHFNLLRAYLRSRHPDFAPPALPSYAACRSYADANNVTILQAHDALWDATFAGKSIPRKPAVPRRDKEDDYEIAEHVAEFV
jgi:hypothetical protein